MIFETIKSEILFLIRNYDSLESDVIVKHLVSFFSPSIPGLVKVKRNQMKGSDSCPDASVSSSPWLARVPPLTTNIGEKTHLPCFFRKQTIKKEISSKH